MTSGQNAEHLQRRARIESFVDPGGDGAVFLSAAQWLPTRFLDAEVGRMQQIYKQQRGLIDVIDRAITTLAPRGWGFSNVDVTILDRACRLVAEGSGEEADGLLAEQWDDEYRLGKVVARISVLGAPDRKLQAIFRERHRLAKCAVDLHREGRYEASVPIALSQVEGITADVTEGQMFFSRWSRSAADLVDDGRLVTLAGALKSLQSYYTESVHDTRLGGPLSRHGVLHGRLLVYDTKVNSAKALSLLDAVVEWARPLGAALAVERRRVRQDQNAGRQDVTPEGRRRDDREFAETREALHMVKNSLQGVYRNEQRFLSKVIGQLRGVEDFARCGLPAEHGVHLEISADGQCAWVCRQTVSGWVLALAVAPRSFGGFDEWFYAGPHPPSDGPWIAPHEWPPALEQPPDWTS